MVLAAETTTYVAFGRPATAALLTRIRAAQAHDTLAPVTVIVPSNLAGLSLRRVLSTGLVDDGHSGLVNVSFITPYQLAAQLGAKVVAARGTTPLSKPVLAAGARTVLKAAPGYFERVAEHAATELAVVGLFAELSRADEATIAALEASDRERTQHLVNLFRAMQTALRDYHDEDDLARAAGEATAVGAADLDELGTVVAFLIDDLTPALAHFIDALGKVLSLHAVIGRSGAPEVDQHPNAVIEQLFGPAEPVQPIAAIVPTDIITVADHDEEVSASVRIVLAEAEAGVPMNRMAILYPTPVPYARALHERFAAAEIPHNGPTSQRLADTMVGQVLIRLLALPGDEDRPTERFRREAVIDLAAAGPLRGPDGRPAAPSQWDNISRRAGVVGGTLDWSEKLALHRANIDERIARAEHDEYSVGQRSAFEREAASLLALSAFVDDLSTRLDPSAVPTSWRDRSTWAKQLLTSLLPPVAQRLGWPEHELGAADDIEAALERLAVLDSLDPNATFATFVRSVQHELDGPLGRLGRFGSGVLVAPLSAAIGLDLDVVIVLGLAEGTLPARRREDSLLPDIERQRAVAGELRTRAAAIRVEHRNLLAAVAAGGRRRVLLQPRGDHRTGRDRQPSRWLLDAATAMIRPEGPRISSSEWPEVEDRRIHRIASYTHAIRSASVPASVIERDLSMLAATVASGLDVSDHYLLDTDHDLARSFEMQSARVSEHFTKFDGDLRGSDVPSPEDRILSASRLEAWSTCPMRYFLGNVLGLAEIDKPEEIMEISALDLGSLTHEILEAFLQPVVDRPVEERPQPHEPWPAAERERLVAIAHEHCSQYEARGLTGKSLLWGMRKNRLVADLGRWLDTDDRLRARLGTIPESVEMRIGFEGKPPVRISLSDGRELRFRGYADRVDLRQSDGSPIVHDYKTGKAQLQKHLDEDPVLGGTKLQLGLYAEAARQRFESDNAEAYYWYLKTASDSPLVGYPFTAERSDRFRDVVSNIVSGIEQGIFPMVPGAYNDFFGTFDTCKFCDFDRICPVDRGEHAEAIADDPAVQVHLRLTDWPPATEDAE